ncbi:MAG: pilus assembly protein TadG-related protein [Microthrixaceae bacterium]
MTDEQPLEIPPGDSQEKPPRERGVVVVWFALMLTALLAMAGFAVDLSNWWAQAERVQKAADAAALAGVPYLPSDLTSATSRAKAELSNNGFVTSGAGANATAVVTQEANPNRLRVSVTYKVNTYFVALLGVKEVSLTREAVSEFVSPVPMGSPENKMGNDPDKAGTPDEPAVSSWVTIQGPSTGKGQGDRYANKVCNDSNHAGCSGSTNLEHDPNGYFYTMKVSAPVSGQALNFEVFDASWVYVGSACNEFMPTASQISSLTSKYPDAATRFASGTASKYCTGDYTPGASGYSGTLDTTFIVREPDDTPWLDTDNPVVNISSCTPMKIRGFNPYSVSSGSRSAYIYNKLMDPTESVINPSDGVITFAEGFRRWTRLCSIPAGSVKSGEYLLQVRTNAKSSNLLQADSTITTKGNNGMSFRAGFGATGAETLSGANVTLAARGRLPIFANASGADTRFYLARVLPTDAGRTLRVRLFDMGDASNSGTLQILPPRGPGEYSESDVFSGCEFSKDSGTISGSDIVGSSCTLKNVSNSKYNGREVIVDVPIPTDYTCADTVPTGCWIKIKASFPTGTTVNDITTWSAAILGNPVRLVE